MSKFIQNIVLFVEPAEAEWSTPSKIGNLFMNRFAIHEDANNEILKIYQLENKWASLCNGWLTLDEGMDLVNKIISFNREPVNPTIKILSWQT